MATALCLVCLRPTARAGDAAAYTYALTSASSSAVYHEAPAPGTHSRLASAQDADVSAGGAHAFGWAYADGGTNNGKSSPVLRAAAGATAGGAEHAVGGRGTAGAAWSDSLRLTNGSITPPDLLSNFLSLHAVFHCGLDGTLEGPAGAAEAYYRIAIDRTDYNGDPVRYEYARTNRGQMSVNKTLELAVPMDAFILGRNAKGETVLPKITMALTVIGQSVYEPSEASRWIGDGMADFHSTFRFETIYFADEHGNPVSGLDDLQIVGDDESPYVMGAPTNGFLKEISVLDRFGRPVNERGITLVDWEGQIANPAIRLQIVPPSDTAFPATATISCPGARVYFGEPSTADEFGASTTLTFTNSTPLPLFVGVFPDRDGTDEDYRITVQFTSATGAFRSLNFNAHVIDQDQPARGVEFPITIDYLQDKTGFFADNSVRALYQQLANDWAYFFADPGLDPVTAGAERTFIWNPAGFTSGSFITNSNAYRGYLLYAYGIDQLAPPFRSGGEPSNAGGFLTAQGTSLKLRRSGGQELEIKGNYNDLGWYLSTADDDWWKASNLGNVQNDLASIPHHEMGHAFIFNPAQPAFAQYKTSGSVQDARVFAYQGAYPAIDSSDHLSGSIDRVSRKGAFGYEYYGEVPARRWLITKLDLLVAQAIGYSLRETSPFVPAQIVSPTLPRGGVGGTYAQKLEARGGIPFYRWSVSSGKLPPGLALDSFTGVMSGVPTAEGQYPFVVRLEEYDEAAAPAERTFMVSVESTPFEITGVQALPTPQVSYRTTSKHTYRVEYSEDLKIWATLVSNVAGVDGIVSTADPAGAARRNRFYRVSEF